MKDTTVKPKGSPASAGSALMWYLAPLSTAAMIFAAMMLSVRVMDDFGFPLTALLFLSFWWPLMTFVQRLADTPNVKVQPRKAGEKTETEKLTDK